MCIHSTIRSKAGNFAIYVYVFLLSIWSLILSSIARYLFDWIQSREEQLRCRLNIGKIIIMIIAIYLILVRIIYLASSETVEYIKCLKRHFA